MALANNKDELQGASLLNLPRRLEASAIQPFDLLASAVPVPIRRPLQVSVWSKLIPVPSILAPLPFEHVRIFLHGTFRHFSQSARSWLGLLGRPLLRISWLFSRRRLYCRRPSLLLIPHIPRGAGLSHTNIFGISHPAPTTPVNVQPSSSIQ